MNLIRFVCVTVFLCVGYFIVEAQPQYVEPAIKIKVIDPEGKPIDKPKVIVYDSAHQFIREEIVIESAFEGKVKKIKINNFGSYYLQFSKDGYEPVEEVSVVWKNDVVNRSPDVIMKPLIMNSNHSWIWWVLGIIILLVFLKGLIVFVKKCNK